MDIKAKVDKWMSNPNATEYDFLHLDINENINLKLPEKIKRVSLNIYEKVYKITLPSHIIELNIYSFSDNVKFYGNLKLQFLEVNYSNGNINFKNIESVNELFIRSSNLNSFIPPKKVSYFVIMDSKFFKEINLPKDLNEFVFKNSEYDDIFEFNEGIKTLTLEKSKIKNIPKSVSRLSLTSCELYEVELSDNIKELTLIKVVGDDYTLYSNLPNFLDKLHIEKNVYIKIKFPKTLINITYLNEYEDKIYEFPPNLKILNISGCKHLKQIPKIPSTIEELSIGKTQIVNLEFETGIAGNLTELNLCDNFLIKTLPDFATLKTNKLDRLDISNTRIKNISNLPETLTSLNFNSTKVRDIPLLPERLINLYCSNNNLRELKNLPQGLGYLNCSHNDIEAFEYLPQSLTYLDCSYNELTSLPTLPEFLIDINCSNNNLMEIPPLPEKIIRLNCSHNQIVKLPSLPPKIIYLNCSFNQLDELPILTQKHINFIFDNNPIFDKLYPELRTINLPISERKYKDDIVKVINLPKGTVLFKGYKNPKDMIQDFIGFIPKGYKDNHLFNNHNVFLYPYPYVIEDVWGDYLTKLITFVLTQDVSIVLGIKPSDNVRSDRFKTQYLTNCSNINFGKEKGYEFDPCLSEGFIRENSDILGEIFIAGMDTPAHNSNIIGKKEILKYRKNFLDAKYNEGVPEVILYPRRVRSEKPYVMNKSRATYEWLGEHMDEFNYFPLLVSDYNNESKINHIKLMDELLSPEGGVIAGQSCHLTIDPLTSFYVLYESCDEEVQQRCIPIEEPNKLNFL
jgi:hypothetical protein